MMKNLATGTAMLAVLAMTAPAASAADIVHDAEYYILHAQNGERWDAEDAELDAKLAELQEKFGRPPNLIHFMWDDQPFGAVGIPAMQKIRGYETPNLNRMAEEGMLFTRMYTEPSCTPTRAAAMSGQHPVRMGVYQVGFPIEYQGMADWVVTPAEVLSQAGYATGFFGKAHLGDIEQAYLHNQGFDEAFVAIYNQVASLWVQQGEAANAVIGLYEELLAEDPYKLDGTFNPNGWVLFYEGEKDGEAKEWCGTSSECYNQFDVEAERRALSFVRRNAEAGTSFYMAWWPQWTSFIPQPKKTSLQRGLVGDGYETGLDAAVGALMETLHELGIAENTLIIAMSDNGPMTHNPPPGSGMGEGPFSGGKGDFLEGGVRVSAQAWWPGVIEPGQIAGDIIHVTDLYTTFARLGGALDYVPTDRIIDGLDQTALLLNGDGQGRRDFVFIYTGDQLGASVKRHYKQHWISSDPTASSGIGAAYYDLYNDPREQTPLLTNMLHFKEPFRRMRARHELWKQKYPDRGAAHGPAYTSIANARPETRALINPPVDFQKLPFDPLEFIEHLDELPFDPTGEPDFGQ
jgi:arylsulfatase